jgi:hypothetical protein
MKKKTAWIVHGVAHCSTCGKEMEGRNAQGLAALHAKKYGHSVSGEIGLAFTYGQKK